VNKKIGCVYLIGAGCGEMDLITQRGIERLRECDVVVYDDLIDEKLLDVAPDNAQRIYMGKRLGMHSAEQNEISNSLVELAKQGKNVARLKGGDPSFLVGVEKKHLHLKMLGSLLRKFRESLPALQFLPLQESRSHIGE